MLDVSAYGSSSADCLLLRWPVSICPFYLVQTAFYLSIYLSIYLSMALQSFCGTLPLFQFLILYTVSRTPWTGDQPVARPFPTYRTTRTQNKRTQTSMPRVGVEPTIPVFELTKTVHALDSGPGLRRPTQI
jgi:hypothetical protein